MKKNNSRNRPNAKSINIDSPRPIKLRIQSKIVTIAKDERLKLFGDLNAEKGGWLMESMLTADPNKTYWLFIDSDGGNLEQILTIMRIKKKLGLKINTIGMGACDSSASFLLQVGDQRYAFRGTSFLLHEPQFNPKDNITNTVACTAFTNRQMRQIYKLLSERTGKPIKQIRADCKSDLYLSAWQANFYGKYGLIDAII